MRLYERDALIERISALAAAAERGDGALVVVSGEAGVGKSALVRAALPDAVYGYCEPLSTPRPLGPFRDLAARLWAGRHVDDDPIRLGDRLLRAFGPSAAAVVVEDAHWIDTASADTVRFVARRIGGSPGLLVVVTRNDPAGDSLLSGVLGQLGTSAPVHRLTVPPLSRTAVGELLSGSGVDPDVAFGLTDGNALLVSQLAASGDTRPTEVVYESVSARLNLLGPPARELAELLAVVPGRIDARFVGADADGLDALERAGLVRSDGEVIEFTHELIREAVADRLLTGRRRVLHTEALARLDRLGAEPDQLAHHAYAAGDLDRSVSEGLAAARRAARLSSHREAVAHFTRADRAAEQIRDEDQRAALLVELAREQVAIGQDGAAVVTGRRALALTAGSEDLVLRSRVRRALGRLTRDETEAYELVRSAVGLIERVDDPSELAAALADLATIQMLARDLDAAAAAARAAITLAEQSDDPVSLSVAANALGSALLLGGDTEGEGWLRRSVHHAASQALDSEVARGYANLVSAAGEARLYRLSESAYREAMSYFTARDLDGMGGYTRAWHARSQFEQGHWTLAREIVDALLAEPASHVWTTRLIAHYIRARLMIRTGRGDPGPDLAEADALARATGSSQRIAPVAAALAERAWLAGESAGEELEAAYALAERRADRWALGELGYWRWRHGHPGGPADGAAEPFRLLVSGPSAAAAHAWAELGCPYEQADALARSESVDDVRSALAVFHRLGARPAAELTARRLRSLGVRTIPRGPRATTARHPDGLTPREADILAELQAGRTDKEIAARRIWR